MPNILPDQLPLVSDIEVDDHADSDWEMAGDVLDGKMEASISHAGGELETLLEDWGREAQTRGYVCQHWYSRPPLTDLYLHRSKKRSIDWRTRQDRILRQTELFQPQMDAITDAYMTWSASVRQKGFENWAMPPASSESACPRFPIKVIDIFGTVSESHCRTHSHWFPVTGIHSIDISGVDQFIACSLVRHGLIPSSAIRPAIAISIRAIEFFRVSSLCSPHFTIHAFARALCHLHAVRRPHFFCLCLFITSRFHSSLTSHGKSLLRMISTLLFAGSSINV